VRRKKRKERKGKKGKKRTGCYPVFSPQKGGGEKKPLEGKKRGRGEK